METTINKLSATELVFMAADDVLATINNSVRGLIELNKVGDALEVAMKGKESNSNYKVNMLSFPKLSHQIIKTAAQANISLKEAILSNPKKIQALLDKQIENTPPLTRNFNDLTELNVLVTACAKDSSFRTKDNLDRLSGAIDKMFGGNPEYIVKVSEYITQGRHEERLNHAELNENVQALKDNKESFGYELLSTKGAGNLTNAAMEELEKKRSEQIQSTAGIKAVTADKSERETKEIVFSNSQGV
jgi:hypothetical protein